ncbi:RusA family crossover junction endodeoxyribonuclease [Baaleninema simplex]|uniref:RusA family crossover junction endodeoxyribonuclease n=1 Tax=Baaleninema simplex TaxID=2862350 RepID=UPI00034616F3|nr:RusA family crossover junction endodeoxyribonuclease [Baaleninema simplex]
MLDLLDDRLPMKIALDDLARQIATEHQQSLNHPTTALLTGWKVGVLLQRAAQLCPPSQWESWLQQHCGMSLATAQTYLQVARSWSSARLPVETTVPEPSPAPPATPQPLDTTEVRSPATSPTPPSPQPQALRFFLPGVVVPKARPRVTRFGTFLPKRYRHWRLWAEGELLIQLQKLDRIPSLPLSKAAVRIQFRGKFRTQADIDNLAGAILDALTVGGAGILQNDNLSCVPSLRVEYIDRDSETGARIEIQPII